MNYIFLCTLMTMPFQCCCGNKFVTLMCCSDDVILGIGIGIGYWYRWRPIVLGILCGIVLTLIYLYSS